MLRAPFDLGSVIQTVGFERGQPVGERQVGLWPGADQSGESRIEPLCFIESQRKREITHKRAHDANSGKRILRTLPRW